MKYKTKPLQLEAKQIQTFIENNKRIPLACTLTNGVTLSPYSIAYLLSKAIQDNFKNNEYDLINVRIYDPSKPYNDTIQNENVLKDDYIWMINNFINFCNKYHRVPRFITTKKSETKVSFELYMYCICKIIIFVDKNKYLPNYCNFNKGFKSNNATNKETSKKNNKQSTSSKTKTSNCSNPYTSTPHYLSAGCNRLGQCTSYWCGPHSIHQILKKFGITKYSEKQIAAYAGSTTKGTDHLGINTAIAKISKATGVKLKVEWKTFSSLGKDANARFLALGKLLCKSNVAVLCHIAYAYAGKQAITKNTPQSQIFGHYEVLDKVNVKTHYVRALNSLGTKKADGSYPGHIQDRPYGVQASFFANTPGGQAALCIITKG